MCWCYIPTSLCWCGSVVYTTFCRASLCDGCIPYVYTSYGNKGFYDYYQICRDSESAETASEPQKERELKTKYEGSHSPFGFIWQIASATGWSIGYILNKVNYQTLIMMLSDAPRYVKREQQEDAEITAEDEANGIIGFFQSKLKQ